MQELRGVLMEGFKRHAIPRLEVYRAGTGTAPWYPEDPHIIAVVTDATLQTELPTFPLQDCEGVAAFILARSVELR